VTYNLDFKVTILHNVK